MISQTAEYALRAIVYLADQKGARTTSQIAETTQIPSGYLAKIMQQLGRAKLVTSQRGLNGGFTLALKPEELTVLEVVNAIDPVQRYHTCPLGLHGMHLCPLHRKLDDAAQAIEATFNGATIANLLDAPANRRPLCGFPAADGLSELQH
ncbi:MAG: Rrf2 family transcriptional regulator [Planctomycetaceae bacterium]